MKVYLAAQLLSRSVAQSLKFCREVLKLPEFVHSGPTEQFILFMNDLFDHLNSRIGKHYRVNGPMNSSNKEQWQTFSGVITDYIMGLQTNEGTLLVNTQLWTGYFGMVCNVFTVQKMFNYWSEKGLKYFLTYKFSQDHIEHFFRTH